MSDEEKVWINLNKRGIYTKEEAFKLFKETKEIDFSFLVTPLDLEKIKKIKKKYFGGN